MLQQRLVWMFLVSCLLALVVQAQDPEFKLRVDVPVVSLDAIVKDSANHPVTHLSQADFEIYEDGVKQEIGYFEAAETPRSFLLVFDVTGVLETRKPAMLKAMDAFFRNVREEDRVGVGSIGPEFDMLMSFRKLQKGKPVNVKLPAEQTGSNIYESLEMAARRFGKEDKRRAVIAMTDGRDSLMFSETQRLGKVADLSNDDQFKRRYSEARKRGVPYYFIALDTDPRYLGNIDHEYAFFKNPDGYMRTSQYANGARSKTIADDYLAGVKLRMERLAEATGGRVLYPRSMEEVVQFFDKISDELGHSYSLGYSAKSADDGKVHKIEVRTKSGYKVEQSRTSYGGR